MLRDGQGCSEMLRDAQRERDRERARETQRKNREERKHGKRREEKDQQEAILILKKICTTQTPDRPPLAAILVELNSTGLGRLPPASIGLVGH